MPAPLMFFDIVGPDMAKQSAFYLAMFDWDVGSDGRFTVPSIGSVPATLREEQPPQSDKLLYFGVDDVAATLEEVVANGGGVVAPRFEVKGVVVLGLFTDPAGNHRGLVEMANGMAKVP
jgi:uncharacterized protein